MVRRQGGALCVVDYRLMHGYVDAREAVWGKGVGQVAGRAQGSKGGSGKGWAVVSPRRITLRKGTRGARARRETTRRKKCRAQINIPRRSRGFFIDGQSPMILATRHVTLVRPDIRVLSLSATRKRVF